MRQIKSTRIGGRRWKILWEKPESEDKAVGLCHFDIKTIQIDPDQHGRAQMDTLIHEALHAISDLPGMPNLTEVQVECAAESLSGLLWRVGYRVT